MKFTNYILASFAFPRATLSTPVSEHQDSLEFQKGCGFDRPSKAAWVDGKKHEFRDWIDGVWEDFLLKKNESGHQQYFQLYLKEKFARGVSAQSFICDGIGSCTIGNCRNLDGEGHDYEMAFWAFEILSNLDSLLKITGSYWHEATEYEIDMLHKDVETYTSVDLIRRTGLAWEEETKEITFWTTAVTSILLVVTAAFSIAPALALPSGLILHKAAKSIGDAVKDTNTQLNAFGSLLSSSWIAAANTYNNLPRESASPSADKHHEEDVIDSNREYLAELNREIQNKLMADREALFQGGQNAAGHDLRYLLLAGDLVEADPSVAAKLRSAYQKFFRGVLINNLWKKEERAYILDTDTPGISCREDARGPSENRVCLDDHPRHSYYLYAIDKSQESDGYKDDYAYVHGPTGYRKFMDNSTGSGASLEDVVRSSLFWHKHRPKTRDPLLEWDPLKLSIAIRDNALDLGSLSAVFSIPVCRNPEGESISGVWIKERNYPCMCGENSWNGIPTSYNYTGDNTLSFLELTGLQFSEDWVNYCYDKHHCKVDPNQVGPIQHPGDGHLGYHTRPFTHCKKRHGWRIGRPDLDFNPPTQT